jgi:LEA14-like dessication related protein
MVPYFAPPSSRRFGALLLAAVVTGAMASGCAKKPSMRLNHADVSGVSLGFPPSLSVVMTVHVDVYNPNSYDVAVRAVRGNVVMANRYTVPLNWNVGGEGVWLAADATTPVRVPVTIPVDMALALVREAYQAPSIPYRFTGRADVTATRTFKIEKDDYSVDEQGWIPRQQVEQALRLGF